MNKLLIKAETEIRDLHDKAVAAETVDPDGDESAYNGGVSNGLRDALDIIARVQGRKLALRDF